MGLGLRVKGLRLGFLGFLRFLGFLGFLGLRVKGLGFLGFGSIPPMVKAPYYAVNWALI